MRSRPTRLVLVGHPVAHSLSPIFQNAALRHARVPIVYEALDVPPAALENTMRALAAEGAGGNVTIPHKETVAELCDSLTPLARDVRAVNTFWVEDGALVGDNTDVGGFRHLLDATLPRGLSLVRMALLGAGGGAAAVLAAAQQLALPVTLFNRGRERAVALQARFPIVTRVAENAWDAVGDSGVVVNATSVGLESDAHPVALDALLPSAVIVDLVYRPGGTAWVRAARDLGHPANDGLPMLVEQGALAFERWFGLPAPRDVMRAAIT